VLVAPTAATALPDGASEFLAEMRACGAYALQELLAGRAFAFSNFTTALEEIHRGTHRPYPCGAGAGYLSVNATGELYACHRVVDDKRFAMGDVHNGPDQQSRRRLLTERHVHRQPECGSCWARYLCGGGCYHEVTNRGRVACDYIRGWLDFCLSAYAELSRCRPEYFVVPDPRDTTVRSTRPSREGDAWPTT
jgi:uncharacterized protein